MIVVTHANVMRPTYRPHHCTLSVNLPCRPHNCTHVLTRFYHLYLIPLC